MTMSELFLLAESVAQLKRINGIFCSVAAIEILALDRPRLMQDGQLKCDEHSVSQPGRPVPNR